MIVDFIQFLYPNGRQENVNIEIEDKYQPLVDDIFAKGYRFEIECNPRSQLIYMDVCNAEREVWAELCINGPEVPNKVRELIENAYISLFEDNPTH